MVEKVTGHPPTATDSGQRGDALTSIESYCEYVHDEPHSKVEYKLLHPGAYMYLFRPNPRSLQFLVSRVGGPGITRQLASVAFSIAARIPAVASILPYMESISLNLPADASFDLVIVGPRTKLIDTEARRITTIAPEHPERVLDELDVRNELPAGINTPEVLVADRSYPYYIEQFLDGRELRDPITEWELVRDAQLQLRSLYESSGYEHVSITQIKSCVKAQLSEAGLRNDHIVATALKALDSLSLPSVLAKGTAHGDLFSGNLYVVEDEVYILDWNESTGNQYLVTDFLLPFVKRYRDTGSSTVVEEMVTDNGRGGSIAREYATDLGDIVFDNNTWYPGVPILYLLVQLVTDGFERPAEETDYYQLLAELVSAIAMGDPDG